MALRKISLAEFKQRIIENANNKMLFGQSPSSAYEDAMWEELKKYNFPKAKAKKLLKSLLRTVSNEDWQEWRSRY